VAVQRRHEGRVESRRAVGVVAACDEALLAEERCHLILFLLHLRPRLGDEESSTATGSSLADRDVVVGTPALGRSRMVLLIHLALRHVVMVLKASLSVALASVCSGTSRRRARLGLRSKVSRLDSLGFQVVS
jgi:hypothetical protein